MLMKKTLRFTASAAAAVLMAAAPGMDLAVEANLYPDGLDLFGYLYQLTGRTVASLDENRLTVALLTAVCLWMTFKYLFHKPKDTGIGEYILSGFSGGMMLLAAAVRTQDTAAVLWANLFQLAKAGMCFAGYTLLFLLALRALKHGMLLLRTASPAADLRSLDRASSFWRIFAVLCIAWLPHIIARYPGVLMWDSYMQIKQFLGEAERWANHPPFGTMLYGCVAWLGEKLDQRNLIYFQFTLLQCASFIAVLSYSLCIMKRQQVDIRVRLGVLAVYAFSPAYAGWATVISKDTDYQIALLLLLAELLVFICERERFVKGARHWVLLTLSCAALMLNRHNGTAVVAVVLLGMAIVLLSAGQRKKLIQLSLCAMLAFGSAVGMEQAIVSALQIQERYIQDVLSLPLQQTARVVSLHAEEIPQEEREVIDRVVDYDGLADNYLDWYADPVKDTYRQTATAQDRAAYWRVWFAQMKRWPVDYLDAALRMNGVLFDLNHNEPMYIGFTDMQLHNRVYPYSFNDMTMYDREALVPLDSAQRAMTEWYMDFDRFPMFGMAVSMSFHVCASLMLVYLCWVEKRRVELLIWLPALMTVGMCLFAPVVYLRYALPLMASLPVGFSVMVAKNEETGVMQI